MQQERGVAATKSRYQVVLVGGNGAFCRIGAVQVRWNELEGDAGVLHDLFEAGWAFFVEYLKVRRNAMVVEGSVECGIRSNEFVIAAQFEWICNDGITVIIVEDHDVFASATGSDGETICLVRGYLASDFYGLQECHVCSDAGFWEGNGRRRHFWSIVVYGRFGGDLGGPNILLLLAKMSLGGC